ncbi:MAG: hypothetical protein IJK60_02205 [Clostridia bacterium]|nr:hypothetical protein [Clostridia bacterium]
MKKIIAFILSLLTVFSLSHAFAGAEDAAQPAEVKLESVEIVSVPLKNRIVFLNGAPETPEGIKVRLNYSDKTSAEVVIEKRNGEYFAGKEKVYPGENILIVRYGILPTNLYFGDSEGETIDEMIYTGYRYLALSSRLNIFNLFNFFKSPAV